MSRPLFLSQGPSKLTSGSGDYLQQFCCMVPYHTGKVRVREGSLTRVLVREGSLTRSISII